MSFLRSKFNSVFCRTRAVSPYCVEFCEREIHDPLFDCCYDLSARTTECFTDCVTRTKKNTFAKSHSNGGVGAQAKAKKRKARTKRPKSTLNASTATATASTTTAAAAAVPFSHRPCNQPIRTHDICSGTHRSLHTKSPITPSKSFHPLLSATSLNSKQSKSTNDLTQLHLNVNHSKTLPRCLTKSTNRLPNTLNSKDCELSQRKTIYQNLCDQFESACLLEMSPRVSRMYPKIPEHDRKILQRMAMKRTEDIARTEDAALARKHWEQEKYERDALLTIQSIELGQVLRDKRHLEKAIRGNRLKFLTQRQRNYADKIRNEIASKNLKLLHRMKNIEMQKEMMQCQRRQDYLRKAELANVALEESQIDEQIRKQECYANLEYRISRAHEMRNFLMGAYQRRIGEENEKQQLTHAMNYDEVKRMEKMNNDMLKQRLDQRERKSTQFLIEKQRWVEESRDQARITAELRDIVRHSISPDNYSYRNSLHIRGGAASTDNLRPLSNLSLYDFDGHLKLT